MTKQLQKKLQEKRCKGEKSFAVLVDPDNINEDQLLTICKLALKANIDFFFVGGSLITSSQLQNCIITIKKETNIPVIIFPGSNLHIDQNADAILLLSLISGRNPDFLIGQHIIAAPVLKRSQLEIIPTGYILIDSGKQTTVSYISNTAPIPFEKDAIAVCTAMAGEMLGLQVIYMDAGSGAEKPISTTMINQVRKNIDIPLIIGGGIRNATDAHNAFEAGADLIVVGNILEKNPDLIIEIAQESKKNYNK